MGNEKIVSLIVNGKEENASGARETVELEKHDQVIQAKSCSCTLKEHASNCEIQNVIVEVETVKKRIVAYAVEMAFCSECCCYYIPQKSFQLLSKKGKIRHKIKGGNTLFKYLKEGPDFQEEKIQLDKVIRILNNKFDAMPKPSGSKYMIDDGCGGLYSRETLQREAIDYANEREKIRSKIDEPYIGRIDLSDNGKNKRSFYIGRTQDTIIGNLYIFSRWSEWGQLFGRQSDPEGVIGGQKKRVDLRRNINIQNGRLLGVENIFSSNSESAERGVYDKFLVEIIKKRKKNHQLTDIIDSIQKKQNDIIERAYAANMIVQGCAGSGKTMVMLHRLSYWLYNNKSLKPEDIRIITPSEGFNEHVESLLYQLNIEKCQVSTISQYYNLLLSRYDKHLMIDGTLDDEENADERFVNYIYSRSYKKIFCRKFDSIMSGYGLEEELCIVEEAAKKCGFRTHAMSRKGEIIQTIARLSREIINKNKSSESDRNRIRKKIETEEMIIEKCNKEIKQAQQIIDQYSENYKEELTDILKTTMDACEKSINQKKREVLISSSNDKQLVLNVENNTIVEEEKRVKELRKAIQRGETLLEKMSKLLMIIPFSSSFEMIIKMVDENTELKNEGHITTYLRQYRNAIKTITKQEILIKKSEGVILDENKNLDSVETILDLSETELISKICDKYPEDITMRIFEEIYNETISDKLDELGIQRRKGTCRYNLYARVIFARLFWEKTVGYDEIICIDEAQDLSFGEYEEIFNQNKDNHTYYNIFGDLKQRIKSGRGLNSWEQINTKLIGHIYELNENYRNTNQITTYCNEMLDINEMALTGVDGAPVKNITIKEMFSELIDIAEEDGRVAVILPRSFNKQKITRNKQMDGIKDRISTKFDPTKISIMYIDEVKGIEFDKVYAVDSGMDNNERYIAYTRALDNLSIVH